MSVRADAPRAGTRGQVLAGWAATVLPIGAWMVHLTASAALVRTACEHRSVIWVIHGLTLATALFCIACIGVGVWLRRRPNEPDNGALRFLGVLAVSVAFVNLLVIVWEGAFAAFLDPCR
jgi:hypothetical protein